MNYIVYKMSNYINTFSNLKKPTNQIIQTKKLLTIRLGSKIFYNKRFHIYLQINISFLSILYIKSEFF